MRTIALPDGSISSAFLDLFGRPSRDTGMESERNNRATPDQRLHLLNSNHIRRKLDQSKWLQAIQVSRGFTPEAINEIYLTILSRYPSQTEIQPRSNIPNPAWPVATMRWSDLAWALLNSAEFAYQH